MSTAVILVLVCLSVALSNALHPACAADEVAFYVATNGNDAWSGALPDPNDAGTDGPFSSLTRARDAIRALRGEGDPPGPVTVGIRGGRYYLTETLALGPEDSGTEQCPVTWAAYPGETPELIGGPRIEGLADAGAGVLSVELPGAADGAWVFRQLFVDGQRQVRARRPNFDPANPYRGGFMYVDRCIGGFGGTVGRIHNRGDRMDWDVVVPADGDYHVWVLYGHNMLAFDCADMGGRTVLIVDGGEAVPLENLPDTGGWGTYKWSRSAALSLTAGEHRIRWENQVGGGLDLDAFALCTDAAWRPVGHDLADPAAGEHMFVIQAEDFVDSHGPQLLAVGGDKYRFHYKPGTLDPAWADAPGAEVHIFPSGRSSCRAFKEILGLQSVDEASTTVVVGGPETKSQLCKGDRFFVENVPALLDAPGEWYLDTATGRLSVIPPEGFGAGSEVVAPVLERIIEVIGTEEAPVSHLRFEGLALRCTDYSPEDNNAGYGMGSDGVIRLEGAADCRVTDCTFSAIGKYAVCMSGGGGHLVSRCHIGHSSSGGVLLLGSAGNTVSGNHIHDCGLVYKHIGGVVLQGAGTDDNLIAHNTIHDMTRYGITIKNGGLRNVIEFNRVERTNLETYDTGGIEVTQHDRELRSGSVIRGNIVADTVGYSSKFEEPLLGAWAIYLDSFAGGYTVTGNITYRSPLGGIMLQGGKDNVVENNIFVGGTKYQMRISNFAGNSTGLVIERNIFYYTSPEAAVLSARALTEEVVTLDHNLYYCPGLTDPKVISPDADTFADWQALGFDAHSRWADPGFVDPSRDDYTLRPDSAALELGFKPIDTSGVGAD
jgi:parallel beta-helix repeat protein